ncbi:DUF4197 family protein [Altererythrobacter salegens]|uniref:DUF4197 family protein n=1 Tax=Croceibacterium salegens TaxID=1737568 RepID=A0A6I4SU47_9SPHN|nr:DUF4197 domain-containing protein [Croceibacterium salegens]MXO58597.1 DUF4197 family protein [Croceibacterium salegens]
MTAMKTTIPRRVFLAGTAAGGALALSACTTGLGGFSFVDAVQRLLFLSSQRAFDRMTADGAFWDQQVASLGLGEFLGNRGDVLTRILTSSLFKGRLERAFGDVAWDASKRAAPVVADTIRTIGYQNAIDLVRGGPTAATSYLRGNMGSRLIDVMSPDVGDALRAAQDPLIGELLAGLTGVNVSAVANGFADKVDDVIWQQIGIEETAIRRDPRSTNDPVLIGVLGVGSAL